MLIPPLSRVWRWLLGTYAGSLWALWAMCVPGACTPSRHRSRHNPRPLPCAAHPLTRYVSYGHLPVMILMLCLLTLLGTYVHADTYFNYSGLVAAFTAPIIVVGYDWTQQGLLAHEAYERRALARLAQSFTGCMVVCIVTLALQASSP